MRANASLLWYAIRDARLPTPFIDRIHFFRYSIPTLSTPSISVPMTFAKELQSLIAEKHLLMHPFYQAWSRGMLPIEAMREYAKQYYHLEKNFPLFLSRAHAEAGDDFEARQVITDNQHDEEHGPRNHRELWLRYAEAIGVSREETEASELLPSTKQAIETFCSLSKRSMIEGIAALVAYESQIPAVAQSKMEGLAKHYGISGKDDTAFFHAHQTLDVVHANGWWRLIERHAGDVEIKQKIEVAVEAGRDALWGFLDGIVEAYVPEVCMSEHAG